MKSMYLWDWGLFSGKRQIVIYDWYEMLERRRNDGDDVDFQWKFRDFFVVPGTFQPVCFLWLYCLLIGNLRFREKHVIARILNTNTDKTCSSTAHVYFYIRMHEKPDSVYPLGPAFFSARRTLIISGKSIRRGRGTILSSGPETSTRCSSSHGFFALTVSQKQ